MSFEYTRSPIDTPPQMLVGLEVLPLLPLFLLASGAAATATINNWLSNGWSVGEYNNIVREMNDTITAWDNIGWQKGCWAANPEKRKEWLAYWQRFSKHFGQYGIQSTFLTDSAEKPVRESLLPQLRQWGEWLNATCGAQTSGANIGPIVPPPAPPDSSFDVGKIVMWAAIGVSAIAVASVFKSTTSLFRRD